MKIFFLTFYLSLQTLLCPSELLSLKIFYKGYCVWTIYFCIEIDKMQFSPFQIIKLLSKSFFLYADQEKNYAISNLLNSNKVKYYKIQSARLYAGFNFNYRVQQFKI